MYWKPCQLQNVIIATASEIFIVPWARRYFQENFCGGFNYFWKFRKKKGEFRLLNEIRRKTEVENIEWNFLFGTGEEL